MKTYAQLKAKVEMDMDTEDETFVQDTELMEYFNDGIREAESEIHKLGLQEIYYLTYDNPSIVSGTAEYAMPSNIFANKIVKVIYNDGSKVYAIRGLKGRNRFERIANNSNSSSSDPIFEYYLRNVFTSDTSIATKMGFTPTPLETTSTRFTRWYIRHANVLEATTSVCDLPDPCLNFLYSYAYWRIWGKEGDGRAIEAKNEVENQRRLMIETLSEMTPDDENQIEMDTDIYDNMS
jgi:hypothetical protein